MEHEFKEIAELLRKNKPVEPMTVRDFLWQFDAQRRGPNVVRRIRDALHQAGLETYPDFEGIWLDSPFSFIIAKEDSSSADNNDLKGSADALIQDDPIIPWITRDPTYRISKLAAANQSVVSVTPDDNIEKVTTLLLARDFSQIPVMRNERDVRGLISWKTIGSRLALGSDGKFARDFMEDHHEIRSGQSIFEAIPIIQSFDYVLVRSDEKLISGIITSSDLSSQFYNLSEPFLILSEIENSIRNMLAENFGSKDLNEARDPGDDKEIKSVDELTFGGYLRLLQNPKNWTKLKINIDRVVFWKDLDNVRAIRNNVTHFDPDGVTKNDLDKLKDFKAFLNHLGIISSLKIAGDAKT